MQTFLQDLRYGFRMLFKNPGFTAVAVISLTMGIGANTAIFSLVNAVLLKPMPVERPDQLAAIYSTTAQSSLPDVFSYPDYRDFRDKSEVFSALVGHYGTPLSLSNEGGQPELIWGEMVTGNYFSGLGVRFTQGRGFSPEEDQTLSSHPVAVLGYDFWKRHFASDPSMVGKTVNLNGHRFTVVGVVAYGFTGTKFLGFLPDIWVPVMMHAQLLPSSNGLLEARGAHWLNLRGRLKPGVSLQQAQAALNAIASQLEQAYPQTNKGIRIHVIPGSKKTEPFIDAKGIIPVVIALLTGVVALVLLSACSNVANLLLARANVRRREIAIRMALGAGRLRIIRQLLTESILLSLMGGGLGFLTGLWLLDLFRLTAPALDFPTINFEYDLRLDSHILGFTVVLSVLTGVLFGLLPALQLSKLDLTQTLKGESEPGITPLRRFSRRDILVVARVAISLVLLIGAGLLIQSSTKVQQLNPGFETKDLLLASLNLGLQGYDQAKGENFYRQLTERVETLPGVRSVSLASPLPLDAYNNSTNVFIEGYVPRPEEENGINMMYSIVGSRYFQTMGTSLIAGREFNENDQGSSPQVVIINETVAQRYWLGQNPIGKRIHFASPQSPPVEVVGIAKNGKYITLGEDPINYFFLPFSQNYTGKMTLLVGATFEPTSLAQSVRREVQTLDNQLPIYGVRTIQQFMDRSWSGPKTIALLVTVFGLLALLMASIGIYGVVAYSVNQRTHEIGVRMALGAQQRDVLRLVIGRGVVLALIGTAVGLAAAFASTRMMSTLLYGVSATDPVTFFVVSLVIFSVASVASYFPARRATKVDPMVALRYE